MPRQLLLRRLRRLLLAPKAPTVGALGSGSCFALPRAPALVPPASAAGSAVYHFREQICSRFRVISGPVPIAVLFAIFSINALFGITAKDLHRHESLFYVSFYLNYLINAILVISLIKGRPPLVSKKLDQTIGDFSYPIYLLHWQAGFVSSMLLWGEPIRGFISFAIAILVCFFLSWLIIKFIDQPVQALRGSIKNKANEQLNTRSAAAATSPASQGLPPAHT